MKFCIDIWVRVPSLASCLSVNCVCNSKKCAVSWNVVKLIWFDCNVVICRNVSGSYCNRQLTIGRGKRVLLNYQSDNKQLLKSRIFSMRNVSMWEDMIGNVHVYSGRSAKCAVDLVGATNWDKGCRVCMGYSRALVTVCRSPSVP
jgi:hypothetical protein